MLHPMDFVDEKATPYPTVTDFFTTFNEEMHSLYLLSFLLTADPDKAEQCLVAAMGECVEHTGVPMDWARSWSRGAVLKHAIRMIQPAPEHTDCVSFISLERSAHAGRKQPLCPNPFTGYLRALCLRYGDSGRAIR